MIKTCMQKTIRHWRKKSKMMQTDGQIYYVLGLEDQYCENDYITQSNLQIQYNPYQITNCIVHRTRAKNFTIHMEAQKTPNNQSSLEKEWSWKNQLFWLQIILQSYSHQDSMVLAQNQKYRPMEQNRKIRNKATHL